MTLDQLRKEIVESQKRTEKDIKRNDWLLISIWFTIGITVGFASATMLFVIIDKLVI